MPDTVKSPKVSIIMPTYNRAKYIVDTIESIRSQTYQNWELIIVDDGSEDNTEELINQIKDGRIKFYKAGRIGKVGKIKNIGLEKANGELIAFIDSDDLWAPTKLETQVAVFDEYPEAGFCLTGGYNFRKLNEPIDFFYKKIEGKKFDNVFISFFESKVAAFTQALMMRTKCLDIAGRFNEIKSFSDTDFILNLAFHFNAVILYEPLLYRRLHDENDSSEHWEKRFHEGVELIQIYKRRKALPSFVSGTALFRIYINFGEKYVAKKKKGLAIKNFIKAWRYKPFSIVSLKKIVKAILY